MFYTFVAFTIVYEYECVAFCVGSDVDLYAVFLRKQQQTHVIADGQLTDSAITEQ